MKIRLGLFLMCFLWLSIACARNGVPSLAPVSHETVGGSGVERNNAEARPLRAAIDEDLPTLDPHHHLTIIGTVVLRNIFEPLVDVDREGEIVPWLAERWQTTDNKTWHFFLRSGVKFHDGKALTVADVLFSFDRARSDPRSEVGGFLAGVKSIAGDADSNRIDIVTNQPEPFFLENLVYVSVVAEKAPEEIEQPVGTGPYRFVSYQRQRSVRLEAFEDYWQGASDESVAELVVLPDAKEAVDQLERGEIDLVSNLPPTLVDRVESSSELWVESRLSQSIYYLQLNPQIPPFADPRVRQAIDLALDRDELMREVTLHHARPASQMLGPGIFGHDPDLTPTQQDRPAARRMLAEVNSGKAIEVLLETTEAYLPHAERIAQQLVEVGLRFEVMSRPWPELYSSLEAGEVGAWYGVWSYDGSDGGLFFDQVVHSSTEDGALGSANWSRSADLDLDRQIRQVRAEQDLSIREAKLQEISREVTDQRILIPVLWPLDLYGMRRDLDWEARSDGRRDFFEMKRKN
ncbi:MAG: hypothetical protein K0U98_24240 [Deltaproteobacteria bacterium]|nr:hypothetical protein [Deltaproteobacteria bacterium]